MNLLFIYGPPGVGKLTVSQRVAEAMNWRLFHNHLTVDLLTSVFEFGSEPFIDLREQIWLGVFRQAAVTQQNLIFTFAPERTVRPTFIQAAMATVESAGGTSLFVELTCDRDQLNERVESPSRQAYGKLASADRLRVLAESGAFDFAMPVTPWLRIDTTALSADETATQIIRHLGLR